MNILFHTTTAVGIIATANNTSSFQQNSLTLSKQIQHGLICFSIGVISHGALDYIPHCYPIPSRIDVVLGSLMIVVFTFLAKEEYRIIVAASFLGSIFPDVVDLMPSMLNKYLNLNLPIIEKIFPWHYHEYSGSIYSGDCFISNINHFLVVFTVAIICYWRLYDLKRGFIKS